MKKQKLESVSRKEIQQKLKMFALKSFSENKQKLEGEVETGN